MKTTTPMHTPNITRPYYMAMIALAALLLAGCDNIRPSSDTRTPAEQTEDRLNPKGSFLTGRSEGGFRLGGNNNAGAAALPVNALLWRASIDTLSVVPLASIDTFSGAVITEWYPHPGGGDQRIKVTVFVLDRELRSDAVRAEVYVQQRGASGDWVDAGVDTGLATRLEDLILTRAREIRASGISESK